MEEKNKIKLTEVMFLCNKMKLRFLDVNPKLLCVELSTHMLKGFHRDFSAHEALRILTIIDQNEPPDQLSTVDKMRLAGCFQFTQFPKDLSNLRIPAESLFTKNMPRGVDLSLCRRILETALNG